MVHTKRIWCLGRTSCPSKLAHMLTEQTWVLCSAFEVVDFPHYLFLNDSFSEDGAQEYAVVLRRPEDTMWFQIETITFGWCSFEEARDIIGEVLSGEFDDSEFRHPVLPRLQAATEHDRCPLCA